MGRRQLRHYIKYTHLTITLFCLFIYLLDILLGDGNGLIIRWSLNPLTIFLSSTILFILLLGLSSEKPWLSNLSLSTLSLLLTTLIIEKMLPALADYQATANAYIQAADGKHPYTNSDTVFFKNYRPGARFYTQLPAEDGGKRILHQINSDGIRGPEIPPKKQNERRILLLGDSYIQGIQVPFDKTVSAYLQQKAPDSTIIIQHGFQSWSPLLQWNWMLRKGLEIEPDLVVLCTYTNDFYSGRSVGDAGYRPYTKFDDQGKPVGFKFPESDYAIPNLNLWTELLVGWQRLRLVRIISHLSGKAKAQGSLAEGQLPRFLEMNPTAFEEAYQANNQRKDAYTIFMWDFLALTRDTSLWSEALHDRVQLSFNYIQGLRNTLSEHNIDFAMMYIPYPWHFANENAARKMDIANWSSFTFPVGGLQQAINSFCERKTIPLLDLYPIFAQAKEDHPGQHYYYNMDPHWNEQGQQLAAKALHEFLTQLDQPQPEQ